MRSSQLTSSYLLPFRATPIRPFYCFITHLQYLLWSSPRPGSPCYQLTVTGTNIRPYKQQLIRGWIVSISQEHERK